MISKQVFFLSGLSVDFQPSRIERRSSLLLRHMAIKESHDKSCRKGTTVPGICIVTALPSGKQVEQGTLPRPMQQTRYLVTLVLGTDSPPPTVFYCMRPCGKVHAEREAEKAKENGGGSLPVSLIGRFQLE